MPQLMQRDRTPDDLEVEAYSRLNPPKGWTRERWLEAALGWDKPGEEGIAAMVGSVKRAIGAKSEAVRKKEFRLSIDPDEPPVTLDKLMEGLPASLDKLNQALTSPTMQETHPAFGVWNQFPKVITHVLRTKLSRKPEQGKPVTP